MSFVKWHNLQYAVFGIMILVLNYAFYYGKASVILSRFLRDTYPVIYRSRMGFRFVGKDNLAMIDASTIKADELNQIKDAAMVKLIYNMRTARKVVLISLVFVLFIMVLFSVFIKVQR